MIKLQEQSLTMTLDGKKEEQSCPNDKRNELCVSMAIKMKDDKSSLQTLVQVFLLSTRSWQAPVELSQFESAGYFKLKLSCMIIVHVLDSNIDFKSHLESVSDVP